MSDRTHLGGGRSPLVGVLQHCTHDAAQVDWPGASFLPELTAAFPDALVVLSVRPAEEWYRSASETIFQAIRLQGDWRATLVRLLRDRFCDRLEDKDAMIEAYESHNAAVRSAIAPHRLLEWSPGDGWGPLCAHLGVPVPDEPFPHTNTTSEFRQMLGLDPAEVAQDTA